MRSATALPSNNAVQVHHARCERSGYPGRSDVSAPTARALAFGIKVLPEHYELMNETAQLVDSGGLWIGRPAGFWVPHVSKIARIHATDLRDAQRQTRRIRLAEERQGRDPAAALVLLDVKAVIDHSNRSALDALYRLDCASESSVASESVLYVGTPSGFVGTIIDIYTADVANGVTITPLTIPEDSVRIVSAIWCLLRAKGFDFDARQVYSSKHPVGFHDL